MIDLWQHYEAFRAMVRADQKPYTFKQWLRTPEGQEAQRGQLMLPLGLEGQLIGAVEYPHEADQARR